MAHSDSFSPREQHGKNEYLIDRRLVFAVAYFGYAFCYIVRNNFKLASSPFAHELGLSTIDIGMILAAFTIAYAPGKLAMGMLVDRTTMRGMLAGSLALSGLICALIPCASSIPAIISLMFLLGFIQGAGSPASLGMLSSWYPNPSRGTAVVAWNTSQNVGAGALAILAMVILDFSSGNWRLVFWIPAALALVFSIWLFINGKERPWQEGYPTLHSMYGRAGSPQSDVEPQDSYWRLLLSSLTTSRVLLILLLLNALLYLLRFGVINWMTFYLPQTKGLTLIQAQNMFAALEFAAVPMVLLFALLAWRWPSGMCTIGILSMILLSVTLLVYAVSADKTTTLWAAVILGGLVYAPQVIVNVLTVNLVPPRMVGAAVGAVGLSGYLVGEVTANTLLPHIANSHGWIFVYCSLAFVAIFTAFTYYALRPYEKKSVVLAV